MSGGELVNFGGELVGINLDHFLKRLSINVECLPFFNSAARFILYLRVKLFLVYKL